MVQVSKVAEEPAAIPTVQKMIPTVHDLPPCLLARYL
jgi:hypothetical protein